MFEYRVKIVTKLGSEYEKSYVAETEEEALAIGRKKFPMYESVSILEAEETDKAPTERQSDIPLEMSPLVIASKRVSEMARCKGRKSDGLSLMLGGFGILAIAIYIHGVHFSSKWLYVLHVTMCVVGLYGWNKYMIAANRLRRLEEEDQWHRRKIAENESSISDG